MPSFSVISHEGPFPALHAWYPSFLRLHEKTFGKTYTDEVQRELLEKRMPLLLVAVVQNEVVGFKLGYAQDSETFYSWTGAVSETHRRHGIGQLLMKAQHELCVKKGYKRVQTKTKNMWRNMLLLNIRSGFNIIGTYTDRTGEPKIILEKPLT